MPHEGEKSAVPEPAPLLQVEPAGHRDPERCGITPWRLLTVKYCSIPETAIRFPGCRVFTPDTGSSEPEHKGPRLGSTRTDSAGVAGPREVVRATRLGTLGRGAQRRGCVGRTGRGPAGSVPACVART